MVGVLLKTAHISAMALIVAGGMSVKYVHNKSSYGKLTTLTLVIGLVASLGSAGTQS